SHYLSCSLSLSLTLSIRHMSTNTCCFMLLSGVCVCVCVCVCVLWGSACVFVWVCVCGERGLFYLVEHHCLKFLSSDELSPLLGCQSINSSLTYFYERSHTTHNTEK